MNRSLPSATDGSGVSLGATLAASLGAAALGGAAVGAVDGAAVAVPPEHAARNAALAPSPLAYRKPRRLSGVRDIRRRYPLKS